MFETMGLGHMPYSNSDQPTQYHTVILYACLLSTDPVVTCPTAVPPPLASDSFHVITQEEVKSKRKK